MAMLLNWKVYFKSLNPEMGQNVSTIVFYIWF